MNFLIRYAIFVLYTILYYRIAVRLEHTNESILMAVYLFCAGLIFLTV